MTKEKCEFYDQQMHNPVLDVMKQKIVKLKPFELPDSFYLEFITSSKPMPPPKPQRLKSWRHDEAVCSSNNQKQNIDTAAEQECKKTFAEKKDFFEHLSSGYKSKGKIANRIEQINRYGLNSNIKSKHKTIDIEEVQQVCEHGKHER